MNIGRIVALQEAAGESAMAGEEFRRLREAAQLTQRECAEVFGMLQSSISRIETIGLKTGGQAYRLAFKAIGGYVVN
jgi:DNA-binding transcriptional regulator YiaG